MSQWVKVCPHYEAQCVTSEKTIYPTKPDGETIAIRLVKHHLHLRSIRSGKINTFTHYKAQGKWHWKQENQYGVHKQGPYGTKLRLEHVIEDVARLVGSTELAKSLIGLAVFGDSYKPKFAKAS